jgi:group I intron endonuclease
MVKIKCSGIYYILNKITNKIYIGMSVDIFGRWASHYNDMYLGKHTSPLLTQDLKEFGITSFEFGILETISKTELKLESKLKGKQFDNYVRTILLQKEKVWMKKHSINLAYNKICKHFG